MALLGSETTRQKPTTERSERAERAGDEPKTGSRAFRLARLLFGGTLAFMAMNNLRDRERYTQYAESKGAPMAETTVPLVSGGLLFGGLGIAAWKFPRLSAGAIAGFLASTTPVMHDFWAIDDDEQQEQQLFHFLKNVALLGAALAFLRIGGDDQ